MKRIFSGLAMIGLVSSALGQGAVQVDNLTAIGYVDAFFAGNHDTGTFGLEVWMKNGTAPDMAINSLNGVWPPPVAVYSLLADDGFALQKRFTGQTMNGGIFSGLGEVDMPGVDRSVNGGSAVLALAVWVGAGTTFFTAPYGGVLTFVNSTSDYTIPVPYTPLPPSLDGFNTDLIIPPVPEPGVFALAAPGAVVLLLLRRAGGRLASPARPRAAKPITRSGS